MTAISDSTCLVFGGYDGDYLNDIWLLSLNDDGTTFEFNEMD